MREFTGKEYLEICIANHFGLDKSQFGGRLKWTNDHEADLERFVQDAEEPFQFAAAVMAYRKTQNNQPTGYLVEFDACASGVQILSTMAGCKTGALNTGLIGTQRKDFYGITKSIMDKALDTNTNFAKADVKIAGMTHFYASKAEPKNAFGDGTPELEAFYNALDKAAPGAQMLLPIMLGAWQADALSHNWYMPDGWQVVKKVKQEIDTKIEIETLEGHPSIKYRYVDNVGSETGISLPADITHSIDGFVVREMNYRCNYDETELKKAESLLKYRLLQCPRNSIGPITRRESISNQHEFLSLKGVESLTKEIVERLSYNYAYYLLELVQKTLAKPSFSLIFIHDAFKCHANYMNYVRQTYIDIFAEMAESNMMSTILSTITGEEITIDKLSDDLGDEIRLGEYALS